MTVKVLVRDLTEAEYPSWNRVVAQSSTGSIYSTPEYLDVLCATAGGRFRIVGAWRGEELAGGVGLYERPSRGGAYIRPRLLLYCNGPVVRDFETRYPSQRTSRTTEILGALIDDLEARGYGSIMLKGLAAQHDVRPFLVRGWSVTPRYTYRVPLVDLATQWGRVEQNLRRLVDRARQQGLLLVEDDDFGTFYAMHLTTLERHDTGPYLPPREFAEWFRRLRAAGLCSLYHVRTADGRVAAAQLVLTGPHPASHTVAAAADPALQSTGANPYLRWSVFEALAARGYKVNDLTDAALNPVTHFKAQLGGDLALVFEAENRPAPSWRAWRALEHGMGHLRELAGNAVRHVIRRPQPGSNDVSRNNTP
jgi:hypothetical protein